MKKIILYLLSFVMVFSLSACGKDKKTEQHNTNLVVQPAPSVYEIDIDLNNLYDFFEFRQYPTYFKDDNGNTTSVQISYGLALKEGYYALNSEEHKDTLILKFTANGLVNEGVFEVDYETLQYSGTVHTSSQTTVTESLKFWPKGNRTTVWTFGNYSSSYIIYFTDF